MTLLYQSLPTAAGLTKYYINNVYIFPDHYPTDSSSDPALIRARIKNAGDTAGKRFDSVFYHQHLFKNSFLTRSMYLKTGDIYSQDNIYRSLNSFTQKDVWQSVNIQPQDVKGSPDKVNLIVQLVPAPKNTLKEISKRVFPTVM